MDQRAKDLIEQSDRLFTKRQPLVSLWQEIGDQFYPERADFTVSRSLGDSFADHLTTSYPILVRRDLGNSFSSMLRPTQKEWFKMGVSMEDMLDEPGRAWLESRSGIMRRAMYDRVTQFTRATSEGDHDFATFGQTVISTEIHRNAPVPHLLYRTWHLRDVVWCENSVGKIDRVDRKWKPTARDLSRMFPGKVHAKVTEALTKEPYREFEVRHIVIASDDFEAPAGKRYGKPWVSLYVDVENQHVIEETNQFNPVYTIPRWQTVSGSQYAYSPATIAGLPDARLIQAMTLTLLEAGEKAVNPPLIATQEAIRSDLAVYAGGVTWVDADYDERKGDVLKPLMMSDKAGIPIGMEMLRDSRSILSEAFMLNKIAMPPAGAEMTATEASFRVQEYIRQALPLFGPMEAEYNAAICEQTFDLLMREGAFGPLDLVPPSLRGQEVQFRFESPLSEAIEKQKGAKLMETGQMLATAAQLDPTAAQMVDAKAALRDALRGIGTPAKWMRSEGEMAQIDAAAQRKQQIAEMMGGLQQGAEAAKTLGEAGSSMREAMGAA